MEQAGRLAEQPERGSDIRATARSQHLFRKWDVTKKKGPPKRADKRKPKQRLELELPPGNNQSSAEDTDQTDRCRFRDYCVA
jgi:hypothetical protein